MKSKSKNKSESGRRARLHFAREWIPMIGACTFAHPLNLSSVLQFCWSLIIDGKWKWKWKWKWKRWLALAQPLNLSADTPALQFCWCKWLAKVWLSLKGRNTRTQRILGSLVQYLYTRPPVWNTLLLYLERCPMTGSPDPWLLSTYYPTNFFQIRQGPWSITPSPCFPQSICFCQAPLGLILLSPGVASTCRFSDLKGDKNRETKVNIGNMDQIMLSIWDVGETGWT